MHCILSHYTYNFKRILRILYVYTEIYKVRIQKLTILRIANQDVNNLMKIKTENFVHINLKDKRKSLFVNIFHYKFVNITFVDIYFRENRFS